MFVVVVEGKERKRGFICKPTQKLRNNQKEKEYKNEKRKTEKKKR